MINNVVLMGRLTAAPELKSTLSGISVTSFCLAVERSYASAGGQRQTDFINCVAWNGTAEFITAYFQKGTMIAVSGSIQTRSYEDRNGNKRTAFEVVVNQASFCGSKNKTQQTAPQSAPQRNAPIGYFATATEKDFEEIPDDDDMPF